MKICKQTDKAECENAVCPHHQQNMDVERGLLDMADGKILICDDFSEGCKDYVFFKGSTSVAQKSH